MRYQSALLAVRDVKKSVAFTLYWANISYNREIGISEPGIQSKSTLMCMYSSIIRYFLLHQKIADHQGIQAGGTKGTDGIEGGVYDWFAPHIEGCV